jgi:hypothetical protein
MFTAGGGALTDCVSSRPELANEGAEAASPLAGASLWVAGDALWFAWVMLGAARAGTACLQRW